MKITEKFLRDIDTNLTKLIQKKSRRRGFEELGGSAASLKQFRLALGALLGDIDPTLSAYDPSKLSIGASKVLTRIKKDILEGRRVSYLSEGLNDKYAKVFGRMRETGGGKRGRKTSDPLDFGTIGVDASVDVGKNEEKQKHLFDLMMMRPEQRRKQELIDALGTEERANQVIEFQDQQKEEELRANLLKNLPGFFKNSKLSTKTLQKIERFGTGTAVGKGLFGAMNRPFAALGAIIQTASLLSKIAHNISLQQTKELVSLTGAGMKYSSGMAKGASIVGFGGSAQDFAAASKSWYGNVGEILMGGGIEKLVALDRFGIDPMGSGPGGFGTTEEILVRIAKRLPKWDKARQLALKNNPMIGISDPMFAAMLAHPNDFQEYIHRYDWLSSSGTYGYGDDTAQTNQGVAEGFERVGVAAKGFGQKWVESSSELLNWFSEGLEDLFHMGSEMLDVEFNFTTDAVEKAKQAALSADNYDKNGGADGGVTNNTENNRSVTINVNGMTVNSNNAEGVVKGIAGMAGSYDPTALATANDPGGY